MEGALLLAAKIAGVIWLIGLAVVLVFGLMLLMEEPDWRAQLRAFPGVVVRAVFWPVILAVLLVAVHFDR